MSAQVPRIGSSVLSSNRDDLALADSGQESRDPGNFGPGDQIFRRQAFAAQARFADDEAHPQLLRGRA